MRRSAQTTARSGFSLLEILVATSMLAMAMAALSQLATIGRSHLTAATEKSVATRLARNQLERIAAGIEPLVETTEQPLAEDPRWEVQVTILPTAVAAGLVEVEVSVRPATDENVPGSSGERWYSVAKWMRE